MIEIAKENSIYPEVLKKLSDKVQDIYLEMQDVLHIQCGDNPIDYAMPEIITTEKLARLITETLIWQKHQEEEENTYVYKQTK